MPTQTYVEQTVREVLATALMPVDEDDEEVEIDLNASLEDEYGAESIDILEIVFLLERAFPVRLPRTNLIRQASQHFGDGKFERQGQLTELGLKVLRELRPEIDPSEFHTGLRIDDAGRLLTGQTFVRLVCRVLDYVEDVRKRLESQGCPECGGTTINLSENPSEYVCEQCGATQPLPGGDEILMQDLKAIQIAHDDDDQ